MDDLLAGLPLFAALEDEAAEALRTAMRRETFSRGRVLFREGTPATGCT